jgi:hypothetical protein
MKAVARDSVFKAPNFIASFYGVKGMHCFMLDLPLKGITDSLTERADGQSSMRFSYGGVRNGEGSEFAQFIMSWLPFGNSSFCFKQIYV